jgi:threonine synthase
MRLDADFHECFTLCAQLTERYGWYNRSNAANPYLLEGEKSCGMEIAEQCMHEPPDWIVMPVREGGALAALAKGVRQMGVLELIDWQPRLLAVEFQHDPRMTPAFDGPRGDDEADARTFRACLAYAGKVIEQSGGDIVQVDAAALARARDDLAGMTGLLVTPTAAAAWAGLEEAVSQGLMEAEASVVAVLVGSDRLPSPPADPPEPVAPDVDAIAAFFQRR